MDVLLLTVMVLLFAWAVGIGIAYLLLLSTQVLFSWPADISVAHVLAVWFFMLVLHNLFKRHQ